MYLHQYLIWASGDVESESGADTLSTEVQAQFVGSQRQEAHVSPMP